MGYSEFMELERRSIERLLLPFKAMVKSGKVSPEKALELVAQKFGGSPEDSTPAYLKFRGNASLIYANEPFFDLSYPLKSGDLYTFTPASQQNIHLLFELYWHLSGADYGFPEELREIMRKLVGGRRVLELGCGPGYNLKVLQDLGADVYGVEARKELVGGVLDVDVRCGDAEDLDKIFDSEEFDLIYSSDLFCLHAVLDKEKSIKVAEAAYRHTREGGLGIHQIIHEKISLPLYLFGVWLSDREVGRRGDGSMENHFWSLNNEGKENALYINKCSLEPQDLVEVGFDVKEYSIENGRLNIVVVK